MLNLNSLINKNSFRSKLLFSYTIVFLISIAIGSIFIYSLVRITIEKNIEKELNNSTLTILNMVRTAMDSSIKNSLRSIAEKNYEIIQHIYQLSINHKITEQEAVDLAANILLNQSVGRSGYIYCVDSKGIMKVHPLETLIGTDLSDNDFIQEQKITKEGYIEYEWANPDEEHERSKALYMTYFAPWDWIISVSSYREDFKEFISIDDFQENILSLTFGETGYSYIINSRGDLIIHPMLQGFNIYDSKDENGRMFIKELCEKKNGKIIYPWKNPGENQSREKLVIFNYIPELDWIVASASYLEEFYSPLKSIQFSTLITVIMLMLLIIPLTWWISSKIAKPMNDLIEGFEHGVKGDFSQIVNTQRWEGELRIVADYYNNFMSEIKKTRKKLMKSEEKYRGIIENALEGIFQASINGKILTLNPAMATIFGYDSTEDFLESVSNISQELFVDQKQMETIKTMLIHNIVLKDYQVHCYRKDKSTIWCSVNANTYKDKSGKISYIECFLTDITERKKYEENLKQSHEILEKKVKERTQELNKALEQIKNELKMAQNIQIAILPKFFPNQDRLLFHGKYIPMDDLGGDYYDVFKISEDTIALTIADVCGHGIPAALTTAMAKVSFANNAVKNIPLKKIVKIVNDELYNVIGDIQYLTAFYGIFNITTGVLKYANAGHNDILILKKDHTIEHLKTNSPMVGLVKDVQFHTDETILAPGDRLILYTDGIIEAQNAQNSQFGMNKLKEIINTRQSHSPKEVSKIIFNEVETFKGNQPPQDDMTLLIMDYK
ncbi:MAG: cache domain-containing protein [Spirochaetes bacterium]|nr:cache domain-containing protein [Spirochaetota bacterium]